MNKKKTGIIYGAAAAAAVIGIAGWRAGAESGAAAENPVYVNTVEQIVSLGTGSGMLNRFAGVVESLETWSVQQNADRTVKEILVKEGDRVQQGTPLYTYDTEQFQEDLARARLELERMNNEIDSMSRALRELEEERRKAAAESRAAYTFQIQEQELQLRQKQFDMESKQLEIDKLNENISQATVVSGLDGVVKSISSGSSTNGSGGDNSFITVVKTGSFRVKGSINEQNMASLAEGDPVIVHSRTDGSLAWRGTVSKIDRENPVSGSGYYGPSGDGSSASGSNYPFYVDLESGDGLMLGQHVYLEQDMGQGEEKEGIWLDEYMIVLEDPEHPFVWADNGKGRLEKRSVTLGDYDGKLLEYEIVDGLRETDSITCPEEGLREGMETAPGENGIMGQSRPAEDTGSLSEDGAVPEEAEVMD